MILCWTESQVIYKKASSFLKQGKLYFYLGQSECTECSVKRKSEQETSMITMEGGELWGLGKGKQRLCIIYFVVQVDIILRAATVPFLLRKAFFWDNYFSKEEV